MYAWLTVPLQMLYQISLFLCPSPWTSLPSPSLSVQIVLSSDDCTNNFFQLRSICLFVYQHLIWLCSHAWSCSLLPGATRSPEGLTSPRQDTGTVSPLPMPVSHCKELRRQQWLFWRSWSLGQPGNMVHLEFFLWSINLSVCVSVLVDSWSNNNYSGISWQPSGWDSASPKQGHRFNS